MNLYDIKLLRQSIVDKTDMLPCIYNVSNVIADSEEEAINKTKITIAEKCRWPENINIEDRISLLSVVNIEVVFKE